MMHAIQKEIQLQFEGYLKTPLLIQNNKVYGLNPIKLPNLPTFKFDKDLPSNLRLGKRVERFVSAELKQYNNIKILAENIQIQNQKITVGELDCLLTQNDNPIHLEIIYKFYLYDENEGTTELDHWIGPNRKDSLVKKLKKLRENQLPLLYSEHTSAILKSLNLKPETIKQFVMFKAQLFTPYQDESVHFKLLNKKCLSGFYLHISELYKLEHCKFYLPSKMNWLVNVHSQVTWLSYTELKENVMPLALKQIAPLCWVKFSTGIIKKCFIVWWEL